jgi:hypothetical protein
LATNRELIEMMVLWENLHPSTRQQHGLKVFQKLSQIPPESLPTLDVTFSTLPTPAHLVRDLFADDDVQYRSCLTGRNEGNIVDFFAGWNALADNSSADINYRIQAPYIAVGVKASKNGLLDCEIEMPGQFAKIRHFFTQLSLLRGQLPTSTMTVSYRGVFWCNCTAIRFSSPGQVLRSIESFSKIATARITIFDYWRRLSECPKG